MTVTHVAASSLAAQIDAAAQAAEARVVAWRRDFHANPELGNREFRTAGVVAEHLRALARVSRLLRQGEVREHLRKARSADAIYALLVEETETSAA